MLTIVWNEELKTAQFTVQGAFPLPQLVNMLELLKSIYIDAQKEQMMTQLEGQMKKPNIVTTQGTIPRMRMM